MTKVAVITGASRGLGLVLAKEFAANGWKVIGTGRSEQPEDLSEGVEYRRFDAGNAEECEAFWKDFSQQYPDAEVCLVNNAGGYVSGKLLDSKPEDYETMMRSCYFSSVYMTQGLARAVPKARVINVISSSALNPHQDDPAYGAAKAAQMHFFQALQADFKPSQYRITNLYPSYVATDVPDPKAMTAEDLAVFVRQQAENNTSYYLRDVTIYPIPANQ